jgi:uncharacterized protein YndB with AHSA1/START domain
VLLVGCACPLSTVVEREIGMTTNTKPIVVEETYTVDRSAVWAAITDPERMSQWYFEPIATFRPEVGFETQFTVHSQGKDWVHLWRVTEVVPERRIAYTFNYAGYESSNASVLWELSDVAGGTRLRLTHTGIETFPKDEPAFQREIGLAGWTYFLQESLKGFLEPQG